MNYFLLLQKKIYISKIKKIYDKSYSGHEQINKYINKNRSLKKYIYICKDINVDSLSEE